MYLALIFKIGLLTGLSLADTSPTYDRKLYKKIEHMHDQAIIQNYILGKDESVRNEMRKGHPQWLKIWLRLAKMADSRPTEVLLTVIAEAINQNPKEALITMKKASTISLMHGASPFQNVFTFDCGRTEFDSECINSEKCKSAKSKAILRLEDRLKALKSVKNTKSLKYLETCRATIRKSILNWKKI